MRHCITLLISISMLCGYAFAAPQILEGKFGRIEIDTAKPSLTSLTLRRPDGSLEPQSLLSSKGAVWQRGMPDWGTGALTFAVDETGRRFESWNSVSQSVEMTALGLRLRGVMLTDGASDPVAQEDWTLGIKGDEFVWTVDRTWLRELTVTSTGTPALFFSTRAVNNNPSTILPNSLATTFWIAPDKLHGWHNPFYRPASWSFGYKLALENNVVMTEPDGWAILKLFPAWQNEVEPRFAVTGGHLYRRGHFGWLSEAGSVSYSDKTHVFKPGDRETTTLRLSVVPARTSGQQLSVTADDPTGTVGRLCDFYGGLINGGVVNDQLHYNFGNETDGWYYGGASWMKGLPMLAGTPASNPTSSSSHNFPRAFRDNLQMILGTEFKPGLTRFGYNTSGAFTDDNIIQIIGGRAYYLYSGDIAFIRQQLPAYRRAIAWYLGKCNGDGLVSLSPAHWYYDAMEASGVTTYHNAFLYKALLDLAGLESASGNNAEAVKYEAEAAKLKAAINRVLWWEDAPGGPRYVDWILSDGTKIAYAADICQFPPVAFGISSPQQAKKLLATLDRRIAELERDHGYIGLASLSAYWPVPERVNTHPANQGFGNYMNGGSFLSMTYWEIMARTAAGDAEGAWQRLQRFAEGTRLTGEQGFIGNNWVTQDGRIGFGACDEPYLSDLISVPAALMQGILGISQTNTSLDVKPVLPASLSHITAEVVHLGMRKRVTIDGSDVKIEELGHVYNSPVELTWHVNAGCPPEADLYIDRTFEAGNNWSATPEINIVRGQGITLKRNSISPLVGLWKFDDLSTGTVTSGSEYEVDGSCVGNVVMQSPDRHGKPGAARFQGGAYVVVNEIEPFIFTPADSFTIQAWMQTTSQENQVIAARPGSFSLGVKAGKLSSWIMQDGVIFVEAVGLNTVADGNWHHVAAVFNRTTQTLSLFIDGKPDGPPVSIASIGESSSRTPLTLGVFGGGFPFDGSIDEISIHHSALRSEEFSFTAEYLPTPPLKLGALTGSYTTATCEWGQPVCLAAIGIKTTFNEGAISAQIETSNDDFQTIATVQYMKLQAGKQVIQLKDFAPASYTRITFILATPENAQYSPVVSEVELTAFPNL